MRVHRLGRVPYPLGLTLQEDAWERVHGGGEDEALFLEHEPVVTLGRRGGTVDEAELDRLGTPVVATDRGGLATWHGPGQLVVYPIVDLRRAGLDVTGFVRGLGLAMAAVSREHGVAADYDPERPGIYVEGRKLGSLGLHVRRGVTTHGLALNVDCDLAGFRAIVPCGFAGLGVTTLAAEAGRPVPIAAVGEALVGHLRKVIPEPVRGRVDSRG